MLQRKRHLNGGFTVGLRSFAAVLHFIFTRLQKVPFICSRLPETTLPLSLPRPPRFNLAEVTFHLFLCKIQSTVYKRIGNLSVTWNLHHLNSLPSLKVFIAKVKATCQIEQKIAANSNKLVTHQNKWHKFLPCFS